MVGQIVGIFYIKMAWMAKGFDFIDDSAVRGESDPPIFCNPITRLQKILSKLQKLMAEDIQLPIDTAAFLHIISTHQRRVLTTEHPNGRFGVVLLEVVARPMARFRRNALPN